MSDRNCQQHATSGGWLKATAIPGEWWWVISDDYKGHHNQVLRVRGSKGEPYFGVSPRYITYAVQIEPPKPIIPTPYEAPNV